MNPKRGELYVLKSDPAGKPRVIVIVSNDALNRGNGVLAVPFYSQQLEKRKTQPWCAYFHAGGGNLNFDCVAKADELTLTDKADIRLAAGPIGVFDEGQMARLMVAVRHCLCLVDPARSAPVP